MRTAAHLLHELESERGSVLMEFCLMLPIWLLMFGGTFMLFDVTMARLHLQEANRNLTWLQNDRYDSQGLINKAVYSSAVQYFEARNELETSMSGEPSTCSPTSCSAANILLKSSNARRRWSARR